MMGSSAIMSHIYSIYLQNWDHVVFDTWPTKDDQHTPVLFSTHVHLNIFQYLLCEGAMPGGQRFIENM